MDHVMMKVSILIIPLWIGLLHSDFAQSASVETKPRVDLYFPTPILEGNDLTMNCRFKVDQNSTIYQVKWYKGSREIFRYQPKEFPPKKSLPFKETQLVIDENQSDMNKLVLRKVPMALNGNVSCEVTWEPSFSTITEMGQLLVVSPPVNRPTLEVKVGAPTISYSRTGIPTLNFGDILTANCTAGPSIPAPNITYFINGYDMNTMKFRGVTMKQQDTLETANKTESRTAIISLKLDHSHFEKSKIRVKCTASLFNLYNESSTEFVGELYRESTHLLASGYGGGSGKNGALGSLLISGKLGNLVWSITTIGVAELVLFLLTTLSL